MIANEIALRNLFNIYVRDLSIAEDKCEDEKSYSIEHEMAVLISSKIHELNSEDFSKNPVAIMGAHYFSAQVEELNNTKLSIEDLSKLPKPLIIEYTIFLGILSQIICALDFIKKSFDSGNFKWATPEVIHDQWLMLQRFSKIVESVRSKMLEAEIVSNEEADSILRAQVEFLKNVVMEKLNHKESLKAASKACYASDKASDASKG